MGFTNGGLGVKVKVLGYVFLGYKGRRRGLGRDGRDGWMFFFGLFFDVGLAEGLITMKSFLFEKRARKVPLDILANINQSVSRARFSSLPFFFSAFASHEHIC